MYEGVEAVVEVTDELVKDTIKSDRSNLWMVEFYAPWCGHCKALKSDWKALAEGMAGVSGVKIGACDATAPNTKEAARLSEVSG